MAASCPAGSTSAFQSWLEAWKEWQFTILMIVTMSLQSCLVLAGFFRKRTSNPLLHSAVWVSFIGLDAMAAYGIGLMLGARCDTVFSLWAPLLLFHLGAADSISAYSAADNELWQRHGFKMTLELIGAGYILSRAGNCGKFLASGVMLFMVGAFKYCERVYALWSGSTAQVVKSARPIYKFMALDPHHHHRRREEQGPDDDSTTLALPNALIVSGEDSWYSAHRKSRSILSVRGYWSSINSVVTYQDVVKCKELKRACRSINEVCLAHALFKIYRRRLTNLSIHHKDDDHEKVRKVFFPSGELVTPLKIIKVIDMELSFIFDGVFTKAAAGRVFQGFGAATRLLSLFFLFVSTVNLAAAGAGGISCEQGSTAFVHLAGTMTLLLVTVALLLEGLQLYKMVRSNWTRVWLACTYITEKRRVADTMEHHYWNNFHRFNVRALLGAFRYVGNPRKAHWHQRIGQRSILVDSLKSLCWHYLKLLDFEHVRSTWEEREIIVNMVDVDASNVHYYLIERVAHKFADVTPGNLAYRREQITRRMGFPFDMDDDTRRLIPEVSPAHDSGLEEAVLHWHVATSVCEMDLLDSTEALDRHSDPVKMSIALSRYCLHLLVAHPDLTPGDPDHFQPLYARARQQLTAIFLRHGTTTPLKDYRPRDAAPDPPATATDLEAAASTSSSSSVVDAGIRLGRALIDNWPMEERWSRLAEIWVDILIYIAAAENAHPHTQQLAKGGQLLTHLWVLLGHLGFGHKSWIARPHRSGSGA